MSKINYLKCIDINPQNILALQNSGKLCAALKHHEQSIICYNQLIKLSSNAEHYFARGKSHQSLKNYQNALNDFTRAHRMESENKTYNFYKRQAMYFIAFSLESD